MEYGLSIEKFKRIPDQTKRETVEAVREGSKRMSLWGNGMVIIYGQSHMPHRKRKWRKRDISWESYRIATKTGAPQILIEMRFLKEMREMVFIR